MIVLNLVPVTLYASVSIAGRLDQLMLTHPFITALVMCVLTGRSCLARCPRGDRAAPG